MPGVIIQFLTININPDLKKGENLNSYQKTVDYRGRVKYPVIDRNINEKTTQINLSQKQKVLINKYNFICVL